MSYFFGRDLWDEMDRVNGQLATLLQSQGQMDDDDDDGRDYSFVVLKPNKVEEPSSREDSDEEPEEPKQPKQPKKDKKPQCQCRMEEHCFYEPPADVVENDTSFVIAMDIPGVKKEDINMDFHRGRLTVSGVRKPRYFPSVPAEMEDKEEEEEKKEGETEPAEKEAPKKEEQPKMRVLSRGCCCGEFERVFTVPTYCQAEDISAKVEDGILFITVKKPKIPEPHRIQIM